MKPLEGIIDYQHRHSFELHIPKLLSLFNFLLSQTNRKNYRHGGKNIVVKHF